MNAKHILFPTDFSHYNEAALEYASTLAAQADALLYIVHVDEFSDLNAAMGEAAYLYAQSWDNPIRREVRERLAQIKPTVAEVRYEHHCLKGAPVTEILNFAERENVDLIVMASHGRTGLSRLVMGSIADGVVRRATCPVLIVKQPAVAPEMEVKVGADVAHT
jgi:nucleotide-binding universal stress UspA family protein